MAPPAFLPSLPAAVVAFAKICTCTCVYKFPFIQNWLLLLLLLPSQHHLLFLLTDYFINIFIILFIFLPSLSFPFLPSFTSLLYGQIPSGRCLLLLQLQYSFNRSAHPIPNSPFHFFFLFPSIGNLIYKFQRSFTHKMTNNNMGNNSREEDGEENAATTVEALVRQQFLAADLDESVKIREQAKVVRKSAKEWPSSFPSVLLVWHTKFPLFFP
jgi:hypothetical protein